MTDEERAKYGNKHRGAYDHYLRNRIAGQIDKAGRRSNTSSQNIRLTKAEYAKVSSAINTAFKARFEGKSKGITYVGDYAYLFKINEFGSYDFYGREEIE